MTTLGFLGSSFGSELDTLVPKPRGPAEIVSVSLLRPADSPRLAGIDHDHVRSLAEAGNLPPILVHHGTMQVIDGMHRLAAAILRGEDQVPVCYFDGTGEEAFLAAVMLNARHGLPLSLADRKAAAARIVVTHPSWSDRAIAAAIGVSHKTVAATRRRLQQEGDGGTRRCGRDGRLRPLSAVEGRRRAAEALARNPQATLQEVADIAGIALGTARDVRQRVACGEDPLTPRQRGVPECEQDHPREPGFRPRPGGPDQPDYRGGDASAAGGGLAAQAAEIAFAGRRLRRILDSLRRDPSLWQNELSRKVLRMLGAHSLSPDEWQLFLASVPPHRSATLAAAMRNCAEYLLEVERQLKHQADALP